MLLMIYMHVAACFYFRFRFQVQAEIAQRMQKNFVRLALARVKYKI